MPLAIESHIFLWPINRQNLLVKLAYKVVRSNSLIIESKSNKFIEYFFIGIVFGLSNTIANMPGFVAPQVAGFILRDNTMPEWQTVFWLR